MTRGLDNMTYKEKSEYIELSGFKRRDDWEEHGNSLQVHEKLLQRGKGSFVLHIHGLERRSLSFSKINFLNRRDSEALLLIV